MYFLNSLLKVIKIFLLAKEAVKKENYGNDFTEGQITMLKFEVLPLHEKILSECITVLKYTKEENLISVFVISYF